MRLIRYFLIMATIYVNLLINYLFSSLVYAFMEILHLWLVLEQKKIWRNNNTEAINLKLEDVEFSVQSSVRITQNEKHLITHHNFYCSSVCLFLFSTALNSFFFPFHC